MGCKCFFPIIIAETSQSQNKKNNGEKCYKIEAKIQPFLCALSGASMLYIL